DGAALRDLLDPPRPVQPGVGPDLGQRFVGDRLVGLDRHERVLVPAGPVDAHRGEVDAILGEDPGDRRDRAGLVVRLEAEGVVVAAEGDGEAVDRMDLAPSAADGRSTDADPFARAFEVEDRRVRVRVLAQVDRLELPLEPGLRGLVVGLAQPEVVGREADQPADDRAVRAVPLARRGEGAVELDPGAFRRSAQDRAGHEPETAGAGRVRRGRPDHDGTEDVEERNHRRLLLQTLIPVGCRDGWIWTSRRAVGVAASPPCAVSRYAAGSLRPTSSMTSMTSSAGM